MSEPLLLAASIASACVTALAIRLLLPAPPRLRALIAVPPAPESGTPAEGLAARLADELLRRWPAMAPSSLPLRLRQAGLVTAAGAEAAVRAHMSRLVGAGLATGAVAMAAAAVTGASGSLTAALTLLGLLGGAARAHGQVERRIDERRERLRLELYTVNQLLALDVRAGGGVAQALTRVAERGHGVAADEIRQALAAMRGGLPLDEALEQAARTTPEPAAARTYRLLAKGARYGADLAAGLRTLNDDLRHERAAAIERAATRRRAAMLVPIIGLLAPVMLLFVAAPLPSIVLGSRP